MTNGSGQLLAHDPDCLFCQIVRGERSASIVAETPQALAFMDIDQPVAGHVLVIPRAHVRDIYGLDSDTAAAIFQLAVQISKALKAALRPDGISLFQANERAGQQHVFHLHVHVLARYEGDRDRVRFGWQPNLPPRNELDRLAGQIRSALKQNQD